MTGDTTPQGTTVKLIGLNAFSMANGNCQDCRLYTKKVANRRKREPKRDCMTRAMEGKLL
jgi:hypothetical protein